MSIDIINSCIKNFSISFFIFYCFSKIINHNTLLQKHKALIIICSICFCVLNLI